MSKLRLKRRYPLIAILLVELVAVVASEPVDVLPPKDPGNAQVHMENDQPVPGWKSITFLEEATTPFAILRVKKVGDLKPVSNVFSNGGNDPMDLKFVDDGDYWTLNVNTRQDHENEETAKGYKMDVKMKGFDDTSIAVSVLDIDDSPPTISAESSICIVNENWNGTTDCLITVKDADGNFTTLDIDIQENEITSSIFGYVHKIGAEYKLNLTVISNLDYEEKNIYSVDIVAKDEGYSSVYKAVVTIVVKVQDVADQPPVWSMSKPVYNIPENEAFSVQLEAYDGDTQVNAAIFFRLDDGVPSYFKVNKDTGLLTVDPIDRDISENDTYEFNVIAYEDPPPPTETQTETPQLFIFMIEDVNDNPPKFNLPDIKISVDEGSTSLTIGDITVSDPDLSTFGTYNVELKNDGEGTDFTQAFSVVPSQGYQTASFSVLVVKPNLLDYENEDWRHIRMKLVATAVAKPITTAELKISIDLNNLNDEFPKFSETVYTANVKENVEEGTPITTLTAIDRDGDIDNITYTTTSSGIITIDKDTGEVKAKKDSFDYELAREVIVQVLATDLKEHVAYTQLKINIQDENDVAPTLHMPPTKVELMEDTTVGSIIPDCYISGADPDTDANLTFSIDYHTSSASSNGIPQSETEFDGVFTIEFDPSCGQQAYADSDTKCAVLKVAEALHWDIFDTITLNISVTDLNTLPKYPDRKMQSAFLTIGIKDVNDNPPSISLSQNLSVAESSKVNQTIGSVVAKDKDNNNVLTYFLTPIDGTPEGWVDISDKGVLYVGYPDIDCDGDNPDKLLYIVRVFDGANNSTANIEIDIEDTNDLVPEVQNPMPMVKQIKENTASGVIYQIIATDGDRTAPFNKVSYLIDPLYPNCWFAVDIDSGNISVDLTENCTLDRETQEEYVIHIVARDNYQNTSNYNSHITSTYVTLTLEDINDNPPEFVEVPGKCEADIQETTKAGTTLATITAKDKDKDDAYTKIDFSIKAILPLSGLKNPNDDNVELFKIITSPTDSGYKGDIVAGVSLHGYFGHYNLTIQANNTLDKDNPWPVERNYTICIEDVNDNPPVFTFPEKTGLIFKIFDTQKPDETIELDDGTLLPLLSATDADYGVNAEVDFQLVGTDYARSYFKIIRGNESNTAKLLLRQKLDISILDQREFELHINATDGGDIPLRDVTNITFQVLTNEPNPPYWKGEREFNKTYEENLIAEFSFPGAYDADNLYKPPEQQDKIFYSIADGDQTLFSIDKHDTPILKIVKGLDYEDRHNYTVLVRASNKDTDKDTDFDDLNGRDILNITVFVTDINDTPPLFNEDLIVGGIAATDNVGDTVLTVTAYDPDTNDKVTYGLMWETMHANGTLQDHLDNNFILDPSTGKLALNFQPQPSMTGFFTFKINATDLANHITIAPAQVFAITESHREQFKFVNSVDFVRNNKDTVTDILTKLLVYKCYISVIQAVTDSDGKITNVTSVSTLFMDEEKHLPVESTTINAAVNVFETRNELKQAFLQKDLHLDDFDISKTPDPVDEDYQQTILIAVSAVLATLLLLMLVAFFFKTRRLNRRLEALSQTKFGSLDSGLNRVGMNVPNTNQHALEGSNPVWNEQIENDDNSSQGSGDSDLVGVEDSPEFRQQGDVGETRMPNGSDEHYGNHNFSFGPAKPNEPTTEL